MTTATRTYLVKPAEGKARLVEATNQAQALRHVAKDTFTVTVASGLETAKAMEAGAKLEQAGE